MEEKKLLEFLGDKKRLPDIYSCRGMINRWRALFPEYEVNTELEATDIYLRLLIDIRLNERRAFNDAVKRMKLPFDLG